MSEDTFTIEALLEANELLQELAGRYRRSNALLRRINSFLRQRIAVKHEQDEAFKSDCVNPTLAETYFGDEHGNILRESDGQIIARAVEGCTGDEFIALTNITTNMKPIDGGLPLSDSSQTSGVQP